MLALHARNVAISTKSGENIYHGLRAVGNPLTTFERYLLHRRSRNFSSGLASTMSRRKKVPKKSRALYISLLISMVPQTAGLWAYGTVWWGTTNYKNTITNDFKARFRSKISPHRFSSNYKRKIWNYKQLKTISKLELGGKWVHVFFRWTTNDINTTTYDFVTRFRSNISHFLELHIR